MQIPGCQNAYCKYELVAGEDWQILDGMENGITQVARQSSGQQPELQLSNITSCSCSHDDVLRSQSQLPHRSLSSKQVLHIS
jgi:hypothetical protein